MVPAADPEALGRGLIRYAGPHIPLARALAADDKRIRGANSLGPSSDELDEEFNQTRTQLPGTPLPLALKHS